VNLIGEHTDYNAGFVFPLAIERYTVLAGARPVNGDGVDRVRIHSELVDATSEFLVSNLQPARRDWTSYVRGTFAGFAELGCELGALDILVDSAVPLGSGLSSSAALSVATATLLEGVTGKSLDRVAKARIGQRAEHEFAGVPCGIMDQFSSALGEPGMLLLIDCRTETAELIALDDPNVAVLIINTNVEHELTGGEYAQRRSQCEQAAQALEVKSLRDATLQTLQSHASDMDEVLVRRARHVISEIGRTTTAAAALKQHDWPAVGALMYASHESLRDDYEVSCPELDMLVDLARKLGPAAGVIGARMTGGGFGGCTVTLVDNARRREVADAICQAYQQQIGIAATAFVTKPARGAHLVNGAAGA
jgi:galactokinase